MGAPNLYSKKATAKNRKPLQLTGINSQILNTRFVDLYNAAYLKSLLVSENVVRLEPGYSTPTEVTVITEKARIASSELFANTIEIEYEY